VPQHRNRFENLSINTNFIDNWTRSSSPMSISSMPPTPQSYVNSPCCLQSPSPVEASADHFTTTFNFDTFDQHSLHKPFELPPQMIYQDDGTCVVNTPYMSHDFNTHTANTKDHNGYASYEQLSKPEMGHHHLELDFATFLPPYSQYTN
jgi:hypothetical protein